jgi:predicted phosphoribosyltransferase
MIHRYFRDRKESGRVLAQKLSAYANRPELKVIVLALFRGGVSVGYYVALELNAPLDVFLLRKLVIPDYPEYAVGAVATGGIRVLDDHVVHGLGSSRAAINAVAVREQQELKRCERLYRGNRAPPDARARTVILVDDGAALADDLRFAIKALRAHHAARIIVALPVSTPATCAQMRAAADDVVCVLAPESLPDVRLCYEKFPELTEAEVTELLARAEHAE